MGRFLLLLAVFSVHFPHFLSVFPTKYKGGFWKCFIISHYYYLYYYHYYYHFFLLLILLSLSQLTLRYWPCNGPIPATVTAQYRTPVSARYVLHAFFVHGRYSFTVSARYQFGTGPIQGVECNGPVQFIWYRPGTNSVPGRYNECNGSVLAHYSLYSIGPVPLQYRADTILTVMALYTLYGIGPVPIQYRADTGPIQKGKNLEYTKII